MGGTRCQPRRRTSGALAVALLLGASACLTMPGRQKSELQAAIGGTHMSPAALRVRVRALAGRFSGELQTVAEDLATRTADPATRLALTRFKVNAIPQMQQALLQPDPVAALIDAWALLAQLRPALAELVRRGDLSAEFKATLGERFTAMESELADIWCELTGTRDASQVATQIHAWAADHPLTSLAARMSTVGLLAQLTERSGIRPLGAASLLLEDTQDLALRMDLLAEYAPRIARWQAEIFVRELLVDPSLLGSGETPREVLESIVRLLDSAEGLPSLITRERIAAFEQIEAERLAFQAFVDRERTAAFEALAQERATALADSEKIGADLVDRAFERANDLADRVLLRLLLLAVVVGLIVVALGLIVVRRAGAR